MSLYFLLISVVFIKDKKARLSVPVASVPTAPQPISPEDRTPYSRSPNRTHITPNNRRPSTFGATDPRSSIPHESTDNILPKVKDSHLTPVSCTPGFTSRSSASSPTNHPHRYTSERTPLGSITSITMLTNLEGLAITDGK